MSILDFLGAKIQIFGGTKIVKTFSILKQNWIFGKKWIFATEKESNWSWDKLWVLLMMFSVFVNVQQCLPLCVFFRVVGRQRLLSKESKVDLASGNSNTNIAETLSCSRFFICVQLNLTQNYSISYLTQNVKECNCLPISLHSSEYCGQNGSKKLASLEILKKYQNRQNLHIGDFMWLLWLFYGTGWINCGILIHFTKDNLMLCNFQF